MQIQSTPRLCTPTRSRHSNCVVVGGKLQSPVSVGQTRSVFAAPLNRMKNQVNPSGKPVALQVQNQAVAGDVQGDMLEPSLANNHWVRLLSVVAVVAASAKASGTFLSIQALGFLHMIAFGAWFGTLFWASTVFGVVAFRTLPRQTFGKLQSKLFPKYFTVTGAAPAFLMGTVYYLTQGNVPMHEMRLLGLAALSCVLNLGIAEPATTRVMLERYALENAEGTRDEEAIRSLKKDFGKWHGISSLLNLVNIICAVGHAWFLGQMISFV